MQHAYQHLSVAFFNPYCCIPKLSDSMPATHTAVYLLQAPSPYEVAVMAGVALSDVSSPPKVGPPLSQGSGLRPCMPRHVVHRPMQARLQDIFLVITCDSHCVSQLVTCGLPLLPGMEQLPLPWAGVQPHGESYVVTLMRGSQGLSREPATALAALAVSAQCSCRGCGLYPSALETMCVSAELCPVSAAQHAGGI